MFSAPQNPFLSAILKRFYSANLSLINHVFSTPSIRLSADMWRVTSCIYYYYLRPPRPTWPLKFTLSNFGWRLTKLSVEHILGYIGWWCKEQSFSFRQSPKWVKADGAQYVLSSPITIVVMTLSMEASGMDNDDSIMLAYRKKRKLLAADNFQIGERNVEEWRMCIIKTPCLLVLFSMLVLEQT